MNKKGILEDDRQKQICGFEDRFFVDKEDPRVEIFIKEE